MCIKKVKIFKNLYLNPESLSRTGHWFILLGKSRAKAEVPDKETLFRNSFRILTIPFRLGSSISSFSPVTMDQRALTIDTFMVPNRLTGFPVEGG